PHLGNLQRYILTAMQEKRFTITGRNPQSAGASVRLEKVPCEFIMVGACNIQDLEHLLSPLRNRIAGNGYEVLMDTTMDDNEFNRALYAQFIAQEISMDRKIPHASRSAIMALIKEGRRRARSIDGKSNSLTLRLRELGGLIRSAGDMAVVEGDGVIEDRHIREAIRRSRTVEEQIADRYGSYMRGLSTDLSSSQKEKSSYYFWNEHRSDDSMFH
ncbi:MAG: Lon-insertion domain-containing protein, partial [Methanomassiliicoccales archaeon]